MANTEERLKIVIRLEADFVHYGDKITEYKLEEIKKSLKKEIGVVVFDRCEMNCDSGDMYLDNDETNILKLDYEEESQPKIESESEVIIESNKNYFRLFKDSYDQGVELVLCNKFGVYLNDCSILKIINGELLLYDRISKKHSNLKLDENGKIKLRGKKE